MTSPAFTVSYYGAMLDVVPTLPCRAVFAMQVHRLLRSTACRYDAIAINWGPQLVFELNVWLRELAKSHKTLPCMLGLFTRSMLVPSTLKEEIEALCEQQNLRFDHIAPRTRAEKLGLYNSDLTYLSPVDAAIEGARCAREQSLPVYGVDRDHYPVLRRTLPRHEPPPDTCEELTPWCLRMIPFLETMRDQEVDARREYVMAARLKTVLRFHRRVLFIGGLHQVRGVLRLLHDSAVRAAPCEPEIPHHDFAPPVRVVVNPVLALPAMDFFPQIAVWYEEQRAHNRLADPATCAYTPAPFARNLVNYLYEQAYGGLAGSRQPVTPPDTVPSFEQFEQLLHNLTITRGLPTPDLRTLLQAAQYQMDHRYLSTILSSILTLPFADPADYPDCASLKPIPGAVGGAAAVVLETRHGKEEAAVGSGLCDTQVSYFCNLPEDPAVIPPGRTAPPTGTCSHYSWDPWDCVVTSLAAAARTIAGTRCKIAHPEKFSSDCKRGFDIRATIRGYTRGEDVLYVKSERTSVQTCPSPLSQSGFPVVFIFDPASRPGGSICGMGVSHRRMNRYAQNKPLFESLMQRPEESMMVLYTMGEKETIRSQQDRSCVVHIQHLCGVAVTGPCCWQTRQFTRWAEYIGLHHSKPHNTSVGVRCPKTPLATAISEDPSDFAWYDQLILISLQHCADYCTVVTPELFRISDSVREAAGKLGVHIRQVPLSRLDPGLVAIARRQYLVPVLELEPATIFPAWAEELIGMPATAFRELVPQSWYNFGLDHPRY